MPRDTLHNLLLTHYAVATYYVPGQLVGFAPGCDACEEMAAEFGRPTLRRAVSS